MRHDDQVDWLIKGINTVHNLAEIFSHSNTIPFVRNCGCDAILDSDPAKYNSERHYFTCHLFTFDCKEEVVTGDASHKDHITTTYNNIQQQ